MRFPRSEYLATSHRLRRQALIARENERPADYSHYFLWLADVQEHAEVPLYIDKVHDSPDFSQELAAHIGLVQLKPESGNTRACVPIQQ